MKSPSDATPDVEALKAAPEVPVVGYLQPPPGRGQGMEPCVYQRDHLAALSASEEREREAVELLREAIADQQANACLHTQHQDWGDVWDRIDAHLKKEQGS